jgi:tRNA 2-selenouridine synthase SelU
MNTNKKSTTSPNFEISLKNEMQQDVAQNHFERLVVKSLDQNLESLPTHINQRLEQARSLAVSKKKSNKSNQINHQFLKRCKAFKLS